MREGRENGEGMRITASPSLRVEEVSENTQAGVHSFIERLLFPVSLPASSLSLSSLLHFLRDSTPGSVRLHDSYTHNTQKPSSTSPSSQSCEQQEKKKKGKKKAVPLTDGQQTEREHKWSDHSPSVQNPIHCSSRRPFIS